MQTSAEPQDGGRRGDLLLLHHCAAFERMHELRASAGERLVDALGEELASFLVGALTGDRPLRAPAATAA